jgi:hypothetical protein
MSNPTLRIGFSHCASGGSFKRCEKSDCDAVHKVIDNLTIKYQNKIVLESFDWEKEHKSEKEAKQFGEKADIIILLIDKEISKRQVAGWKYHQKQKDKEKPYATYFIYVRISPDMTEEEFRKYEKDEIYRKLPQPNLEHYWPFTETSLLFSQLWDDLEDEIKKRVPSNEPQPDLAEESNGGEKIPKWLKWFIWTIIVTLVLTGIAFALLKFGPRDPGGDSGSIKGFDTSTVVVHGDSVSTPNSPERIIDRGGTGHHNNHSKENDTPNITKPAVALDAFRVEANPSGFAASLSDGIKESVPSISEIEDNPRWIITVTEDNTAEEIFVKTAPNDWDKVKIRFVVSIVDATGTLSTKKTIVETVGKSPSGIEAARTKARDTAVPQIIDVISDYIR